MVEQRVEQQVQNWGNYPVLAAAGVTAPAAFEGLALALGPGAPLIARGNGRCYGDAALQRRIVSTLRWNKVLGFDREQGIFECEAGVLLADVLALVVPHGFFLPVTPGTKYVTVGGAVAANVHGKNHHHAGAFGRYVEALEVLTETGEQVPCSRTQHPELFRQTIGGMGLTGIIVAVRFRLSRLETAYLHTARHPAANLAEVLALLDAHRAQPYLVAWLDGLRRGPEAGRGIVHTGRPAALAELGAAERAAPLRPHGGRQLGLPGYLPRHTLNRYTIGLYNAWYYRQNRRPPPGLTHYDDFFYPLDKLRDWNRLYGRPGFVQYQLVLPPAAAAAGLAEVLAAVHAAGCSALLAVLKVLGAADAWAAPISFPMEGHSLALDFRVTPAVLALLDRLDAIVLHHGGRLYLAKDARMPAEVFARSYPAFAHPAAFQSLQSQRLGI